MSSLISRQDDLDHFDYKKNEYFINFEINFNITKNSNKIVKNL